VPPATSTNGYERGDSRHGAPDPYGWRGLTRTIRESAIKQYSSPYLSLDLHKMADAFKSDMTQIQQELSSLIIRGEIHARIDKAAGVLRALTEPLLPQFGTEIERLRARIALGTATQVELALDRGLLLGGAQNALVSAPLCELELEWLEGPLAPLWDEGERLVRAHSLVLEPRSKAARGHALARGEAVPAADWGSVADTLAAISEWRRAT
jgi:hypothetical protein